MMPKNHITAALRANIGIKVMKTLILNIKMGLALRAINREAKALKVAALRAKNVLEKIVETDAALRARNDLVITAETDVALRAQKRPTLRVNLAAQLQKDVKSVTATMILTVATLDDEKGLVTVCLQAWLMIAQNHKSFTIFVNNCRSCSRKIPLKIIALALMRETDLMMLSLTAVSQREMTILLKILRVNRWNLMTML